MFQVPFLFTFISETGTFLRYLTTILIFKSSIIYMKQLLTVTFPNIRRANIRVFILASALFRPLESSTTQFNFFHHGTI